MLATYYSGSQVTETPSDGPTDSLAATLKSADGTVVNLQLLEARYDFMHTGHLAKHGRVPLHSVFEQQAFVNHAVDERDFATVGDHFDLSTGTDGAWSHVLVVSTLLHLGFAGVERRIAHGEVKMLDAEVIKREEWAFAGREVKFYASSQVVEVDVLLSRFEVLVVNLGTVHVPSGTAGGGKQRVYTASADTTA